MGFWFKDFLEKNYGKTPKDAQPSGVFNKEKTTALGGEYSDYLSDLFGNDPRNKDYGTDPRFLRDSGLIRDLVDTQTGADRQRFGDQSVVGGFNDSGYRQTMMNDINRGGTQAYAQGLVQLLGQLEDRDLQAWETELNRIFPFLMGTSEESVNIQNINIGKALEARQQNLNKGTQVGNVVSSSFS